MPCSAYLFDENISTLFSYPWYTWRKYQLKCFDYLVTDLFYFSYFIENVLVDCPKSTQVYIFQMCKWVWNQKYTSFQAGKGGWGIFTRNWKNIHPVWTMKVWFSLVYRLIKWIQTGEQVIIEIKACHTKKNRAQEKALHSIVCNLNSIVCSLISWSCSARIGSITNDTII